MQGCKTYRVLVAAEGVEDHRQAAIQSLAFVIGISISVILCLVWVPRHSHDGCVVVELYDRVNVNVEPIGSLIRLPGIGIGRASAIAAYRQQAGSSRGDRNRVFERCDDLEKIKGIGPKTVEGVRDYVVFE
jgi:hypothetical protein